MRTTTKLERLQTLAKELADGNLVDTEYRGARANTETKQRAALEKLLNGGPAGILTVRRPPPPTRTRTIIEDGGGGLLTAVEAISHDDDDRAGRPDVRTYVDLSNDPERIRVVPSSTAWKRSSGPRPRGTGELAAPSSHVFPAAWLLNGKHAIRRRRHLYAKLRDDADGNTRRAAIEAAAKRLTTALVPVHTVEDDEASTETIRRRLGLPRSGDPDAGSPTSIGPDDQAIIARLRSLDRAVAQHDERLDALEAAVGTRTAGAEARHAGPQAKPRDNAGTKHQAAD